MQPAYYEDFTEIKKKIWSMLDDAVKNRSSQFRIPTFICGHNNDIDGRIVVLRKADNKTIWFNSIVISDQIKLNYLKIIPMLLFCFTIRMKKFRLDLK